MEIFEDKKGKIMIIGIDIDDVLTNTSEKMKEYVLKYDTSGDGIKYFVELMRGEFATENIEKFYNIYRNEIIKSVKIKENAEEVLKRLVKNGHKIIFVTARDSKAGDVKNITLEFMKQHNIEYADIIFDSHHKQEDCKNNNIDILIDDSVKNCETVKENGIDTILFETEVNKDMNTNIEKVKNWLELEEKINLRASNKK